MLLGGACVESWKESVETPNDKARWAAVGDTGGTEEEFGSQERADI